MGLDLLYMTLKKMWLTMPSWQLTRKPLFQVRCRQCVTFDISPVQFTICSSATTDALLTNLVFFQVLRQSGNPWITLYLYPMPGKEDHIFILTVEMHICAYLIFVIFCMPRFFLVWKRYTKKCVTTKEHKFIFQIKVHLKILVGILF